MDLLACVNAHAEVLVPWGFAWSSQVLSLHLEDASNRTHFATHFLQPTLCTMQRHEDTKRCVRNTALGIFLPLPTALLDSAVGFWASNSCYLFKSWALEQVARIWGNSLMHDMKGFTSMLWEHCGRTNLVSYFGSSGNNRWDFWCRPIDIRRCHKSSLDSPRQFERHFGANKSILCRSIR